MKLVILVIVSSKSFLMIFQNITKPGDRVGDGTAGYPASSKNAPKLSFPRKKLLSKFFLVTKDLKLVSNGSNSPSFNGSFEIRYPISVRLRNCLKNKYNLMIMD